MQALAKKTNGCIVVASYNTHGAVGLDGRCEPQRIAKVIAELGADIVALQELRSRNAALESLEFLPRDSGYQAISGPTLTFADGEFGNGLLTRFPVLAVEHIRLDVGRREPRAAIDATLDVSGLDAGVTALRVIATHLGLGPRERNTQIARLLEVTRARTDVPTILLGDLNEWFLRSRSLRKLHDHFGESPARATFPSWLPLLALDRIWCAPAAALRDVRVHRSRRARTASDHLPLLAEVELTKSA